MLLIVVLLLIIVPCIRVITIVEVHLFFCQGNKVIISLIVEEVNIELVTLSVLDGLFQSQWFFLTGPMILHGCSHGLSLLRFETKLHQFQVILAADLLTHKDTNVQSLF